MCEFVYKGNKTKEISFPLGGIGTGSIGLSGNGRLIDWEIYNRPDKGSINGFSHFAVKAEVRGEIIDARVLNGDLQPPYTGKYTGYGFGADRGTMAGFPHFRTVEFTGEFPFAQLRFYDGKFPGMVEMTAFNPLIPLNDRDSSIPGAFFDIEIENTSTEEITYTVCMSLQNPLSPGATINTYNSAEKIHSIRLMSDKYRNDEPGYGDLCVATDCGEASYQEYWYRGSWFDNAGIYWREFAAPGRLANRTYVEHGNEGNRDICSLAAHIDIEAGRKEKVRFIITWNFPNCYNYWNPEQCNCGSGQCKPEDNGMWKNFYATLFENAQKSAIYSLKHWNELYGKTREFKDALFSSTLPHAIIDAISANISILKTPTCLRLEDGSFYGFEGCHCTKGCCEGSCTHVWNYAYALPFLFPKLERSMRDLDFKYNQAEDGGMSFRLQLPLGRKRSGFRPCADGQFGGVVKTYRDWKISGDREWLKKNWEAVKKCIEYAWAESNYDRWDHNRDGVLEGRQHHTLDMELFGPNSWLTGFYLAALKAGIEMAECLGEEETAKKYKSLFKKGKQWADRNLFNGEYYHQLIDLTDRSILEKFDGDNTIAGGGAVKAYWNDEKKEIKYQIGMGCIVDQVIAQWHANLCGLGEIFDRQQVRKALQSVYKNNFKKNIRDFINPCRLYTLNDEAGVVICEWPEGVYKPIVPVPYAEETMNGFEYQFAAHLLQEGMAEEATEVVKAVRDRYDGEKRNPWNEFECGSNYARSMASFALLLAFSGFEYNMAEGLIGFNPVAQAEQYRCFWSLDTGWGIFETGIEAVSLKVLYGSLEVASFNLPFLKEKQVLSIQYAGRPVEFTWNGGCISLCKKLIMEEGSVLMVKVLYTCD